MCEFVKSENVMPGYGCCNCKVYNGLQRTKCKNCNTVHCELKVTTGTIGIYQEEGALIEVEILGLKLDENGVGYTLKVIKTLQSSPIVDDIPIGEVFDAWTRHDYHGGWQLY